MWNIMGQLQKEKMYVMETRKETTEVISMTNNFPNLCETPNPIFRENPAERTSNQFI